MNKLYFTRVVEKTRGLFTSSPRRGGGGGGQGGGERERERERERIFEGAREKESLISYANCVYEEALTGAGTRADTIWAILHASAWAWRTCSSAHSLRCVLVLQQIASPGQVRKTKSPRPLPHSPTTCLRQLLYSFTEMRNRS